MPLNDLKTAPGVRLGPSAGDRGRRHLETLLDSGHGAALQPFERELLCELADALATTPPDDRGAGERAAAAGSALIVGLVFAGRVPRPHAHALWDALCECGELSPAARRLPIRLLPSAGAEPR